MNQPARRSVDPPHIAAIDGELLRRELLGQLQRPYLAKVTILAYRYNDFGLDSGRPEHAFAGTGLIRLLERVASSGVDLTLVTRDPTKEREWPTDLPVWYAGLARLARAGANVRLHPSLHAKVYLMESSDRRCFFAVGSSNLTYQGMGARWSECNVRGFHDGEYELIRRHAFKLAWESGCTDFRTWQALLRRNDRGMSLLRAARA